MDKMLENYPEFMNKVQKTVNSLQNIKNIWQSDIRVL